MRQSVVPCLAFSAMTHLALTAPDASLPDAVLGSRTCTWPNSACRFPAALAPGLATPHTAPAPTDSRTATMTMPALLRITAAKSYRAPAGGLGHAVPRVLMRRCGRVDRAARLPQGGW